MHLLLCHLRALLVNSALFLKFTALKFPFQIAPCPFENLGRTLDTYRDITKGAISYVTTCIAIQGPMKSQQQIMWKINVKKPVAYTTFNNNLFQTIMYNVFIELNNNNANARCCRDKSKLHSIQ